MSFDVWVAFAGVWLFILLSPGPNAAFCIATGARLGAKAGMVAALGVVSAVAILLTATASGLGALMLASATLFEAIKWIGVGYLVWLGISQWRAPVADHTDGLPVPRRMRRIFLQAFMIALTNPKAFILYALLLPPFIDSDSSATGQFLWLGITAIAMTLMVYGVYSLIGGRLSGLFGSLASRRWRNRGFGTFFIMAGAAMAFAERR
tara:strand:- start:4265 stop:4885 length:621 start_codon:yes stop_codon:yes gene_type:complete